jgi:hypothetical protein
MKKSLQASVAIALIALVGVSCSKDDSPVIPMEKKAALPDTSAFIKYTIAAGGHYCDKNVYQPASIRRLQFVARFDSSAVYTSGAVNNQYDINKLYGFSDNNMHHHVNSARFGWRWNDDALRIFAYVYNDEQVITRELGVVLIGADMVCSITVDGDAYIFELDGRKVSLPRTSKTASAEGYRLYPYFGGDETAPHNIQIAIKEL